MTAGLLPEGSCEPTSRDKIVPAYSLLHSGRAVDQSYDSA